MSNSRTCDNRGLDGQTATEEALRDRIKILLKRIDELETEKHKRLYNFVNKNARRQTTVQVAGSTPISK